MAEHDFTALLWEWSGKGSWCFITVPADISGIIRMSVPKRAGFGSVRVIVESRGERWKTSLFPDVKSGCYLLPVKAGIRKTTAMKIGEEIHIGISLAE